MWLKLLLVLILMFKLFAIDNFDKQTIIALKKMYGNKMVNKLRAWDKMIKKAKKAKVLYKLKYVNDFFNYVHYITDIKHWGKIDYWATPFEFVGTSGGDCEDYAIAKYFTLIKVGIPENKLRIAYVKLLRKRTGFEENHMVLLYYHKPGMSPIVLDNVNKKLKLATKRKDLKLVYSFNAKGLWKAKKRGKGSVKIGKNKLHKWQNLINKM